MQESYLALPGDGFCPCIGFLALPVLLFLYRTCEDFRSQSLLTDDGLKVLELMDSFQFLDMKSNVCCDGVVTVCNKFAFSVLISFPYFMVAISRWVPFNNLGKTNKINT